MRIDYKTWGLIILGLLVAALVVLKDPWNQWPAREGLDIAGGVRVVMELVPTNGVPINADTQKQVIDVLESRVNGLGVSEPVIQPKGTNQVIVELAESSKEKGQPLDKRSAVQTLTKTAKLEFIYLKDIKSDKNPLGRYDMRGSTFTDLRTSKTLSDEEVRKQILYNDPKNLIITGRNLVPGQAHADFSQNGGGVKVNLELDKEGTDKFADFTRNHVKEYMAIVYDGKVQSAPIINEEIPGGQVMITLGNSKLSEAVEMANLLNSGALPVPLRVAEIEEVEASLGRDSVASTQRAGILGMIGVVVFMAAYYLLPGLLADLALVFYAILTFAIFKVLGVVLTLPGIAGFILSIGMAVDANILIFERTKEELRAGKTLHSAIDAGFTRAFPSIRDSNLSTLITCAILWMYGAPSIKGFALVLGLGVIVSFFTAVTVTRTLLHLVVNENVSAHPSWFGVTRSWMNRQGQRRVDVVRNRNYFFGLSLALIVPGILFLSMGGLKPGIDFTGGSMIHYSFSQKVDADQLRRSLSATGLKDVQVQLSQGTSGAAEDAFVRSRVMNDAQRDAALKAIQSSYPKARSVSYGQIGPSISRELVVNAFWTVVLASLLITLFLAYQFKSAGLKTGLKYGVCAVIALLHDVFVLLGIFAIAGYFLNWEVDSLFVTAMLTMIGFSVHDTIVIFDRIRENWRNRAKDADFGDIINASVNQTLSRSINTSFTVILTLLALFFFGGAVLKLFVAALLFGIISGTYSSIFNASPLLWLWERNLAFEKPASSGSATGTPARRSTVLPAPGSTPLSSNRPRVGVPTSSASQPSASHVSSDEGDRAATNGSPGSMDAEVVRSKVQVRSTKRKKRF